MLLLQMLLMVVLQMLLLQMWVAKLVLTRASNWRLQCGSPSHVGSGEQVDPSIGTQVDQMDLALAFDDDDDDGAWH